MTNGRPKAMRPGNDQSSVSSPARGRQWDGVVGRAVFEILIVAVGVMLALAVDEWRETQQQDQLAEDARTTLRAEILANRQSVFNRLDRIGQLYVLVQQRPDRVGDYVFDRRNRALLLNDSAWIMAVETGALRYLLPQERASVTEVYAGHERLRDVTREEMSRWSDLAAFPQSAESPATRRERDRAIRIWQAFALRVQLANCATAGRYERALGGNLPYAALTDFCASRQPDEKSAAIYDEWKKLGWASSLPPRFN